MSMNENLEAKMAQLTDVIKGMSDTPKISAADLNDVLNNLVQKIEVSSDEKNRKLATNLQSTLTDALENKYSEIKEKLSNFENFVTSIDRTVSNPRVDEAVTRILNDIEALHSKMSSSEIQTEALIRSFDALKNASNQGQINKLFDEVIQISKTYDGIVEVLNGNFKEFLKQIEEMSTREEFQKVRFSLEKIENGHDVLLSAMNSLNERQEEVKNLVRMSNSSSITPEKMEQMQSVLTRLNDVLRESASKTDIEQIEGKIASVTSMLAEFRKTFEDSTDTDFKNVYHGQLNNIIAKLENMRASSGGNNEDIMRLYSSIAEFKDGIYSTVNQKLNDVITSMEGQFDKISNSMLTSTMEASETTSNLASEIQKLKGEFETITNLKSTEVKEEIKKQSSESVITAVNAIKGELSRLSTEIQNADNKEQFETLTRTIDSLKAAVDMRSVIEGFEQVKAAMSLNPLRDELMRLNKEDLLNSISEKIDTLLQSKGNQEIMMKLEEIGRSSNVENLYRILDSINQKIDFSTIDEKLSNLREFITNADFTGEIVSIREKLGLIDNIGQGLVSVKNIDFVLSEIKTKIEDSFRLNSQRINEDTALQNEVRQALNTIYEAISTIPRGPINISMEGVEAKLNAINENMAAISGNLPNIARENFNNVEKAANIVVSRFDTASSKIAELLNESQGTIKDRIDEVHEKLSGLDMKLSEESADYKITEIKERIELLDELLKEVSNNTSNEKIAAIEKKLLNSAEMSNKETREILVELQNSFATNIKAIKTYIMQAEQKPSVADEFGPVFDELEARIAEKFVSVETLLEENQANFDKRTGELVASKISSLKDEIQAVITPYVNTVKQGISDIVSDLIRRYKEELMLEVSDSFKGELDALVSFLKDSREANEKELLTKFVQILSARENSEARVNYVKSVTGTLSSILEKTNSTKDVLDGFKDYLNGVNEAIQRTEQKILESVANKDEETEHLISSLKEAVQETMTENDKFRNFDPEALINSLNDIMDGNEKITDRINEEISSNISVLSETARTLESVNNNIGDYIAQNNINNEGLSELIRRLENCVNENNSDYINLLNAIKEEIAICDDRTNELIRNANDEIRESMEALQGSLEDIVRRNSFDEAKFEELQNSITNSINSAAGDRNERLENTIQKALEETKNDIMQTITSSKDNDEQGLERKIETLFNDNKEALINAIRSASMNNDAAAKINDLITRYEEASSARLDEKIKTKVESIELLLKEKMETANNDDKLANIQKAIDTKLHKIVNDNNEVIRDELKLQADNITSDVAREIGDKIERMEAFIQRGAQGNDALETYTLADVEADIAKIRLSLEKNNKLTNFKEFAARLIELKNINLENSKISRAIGSDIMRFDTWLKNATAKIDLLSAKLDNKEKVKFDDLKSKISSNENQSASSQKLEDAIMSIYKKYRTQESKIDDVVIKLEAMAQAQAENFDMKEFIDLFYENNKKQQNLISRMDSLEDKMDLIQAKIDHIISSCIDE